MEYWHNFKDWFFSLGEQYNVNPYIFGSIYLGAIPFFFLCIGWTIRNIKQDKSFTLPLLLTGFCFISAYLYLVIVGKNIPMWVYIFIGVMLLYGAYSTYKKINKSKNKNEP